MAEHDRSEALPLYVVDDALETVPHGRGHHLLQPGAFHQGLEAMGRVAHDLSDRLAVPATIEGGSVSLERLREVVIHITRHLVMPPSEAARSFDHWLAGAGGQVTTQRGSLRLAAPSSPGLSEHGPAQLRSVAGRLSLRLSPAPLPVELELVPWGEWRTVLTLRPDRRLGRTVGPHRRSRYFAAGHATMDVIVHRLRAGADPADHPYDGEPCGLWSSTHIPATTA